MADTAPSHLENRASVKALWIGIGFFLLVSIPFLIWPFNPHPDERLYTVAAAEMMASGDYLVPKSETGNLRLKKPPLTYYYVVLGFKMFGETLFGAKILMVLSAAAILALSYSLSRALGVDRDISLLGAAIIGGHKIFFSTSNQHIPDMPLVLGISLALVGFVHILSREKPGVWVYYLAWLGVTFAVLAKGLLVLLLVALYLPFRLYHAQRLRLNLHEGLAVLLATAVSASWFIYIASVHPDALIAQFFGDQVTGKAGFDPAQVLRGVQKTFLDLTLPALPFLVGLALAFALGRNAGGDARTPHMRAPSRGVVFLVAWCAVTVLVFAFSTQLYERYILPALPAFAALIALLGQSLSRDRLTRGLKGAMWIFLPLPFLVVLVSLAFAWKFAAFAMGAGLLCALAALLLALWWISRKSPFLMALAGLSSVWPLIALAILPLQALFLFPTAGQHVKPLGWGANDAIVILDDPKLADDVGLQIGNIDRLHYRRSFEKERDGAVKHVLFLNAKHLPAFEAMGFDIETFHIFRDLDVDMTDIREVWEAGNAEALAETHAEVLYVAHSR